MQKSEIIVFKPGSTKKEATISSLVPRQAADALAEHYGAEAGEKARKALNSMQRLDLDFVQFRMGEQRVRVRQVEA